MSQPLSFDYRISNPILGTFQMLPNFMIIGAMKAGTSSLFRYLASHPEIVPSSIKETDFFFLDSKFKQGTEWYERLFKGAGTHALEASPNYTKRQLKAGIPERIHALLPDIKMVFVVRDPVERLISHYVHNIDHGRERRSFSEAIEDTDSNYYQTSRYFFQLEAFLEFFAPEQILVVPSERLRDETQVTVEKVCAFYGISPDCDPKAMEQKVHSSSAKTAPSRLESGLLKLTKNPSRKKLIQRHTQRFRRPIPRPCPPERELAYMKKALASDANALRDWSGEKFLDWNV